MMILTLSVFLTTLVAFLPCTLSRTFSCKSNTYSHTHSKIFLQLFVYIHTMIMKTTPILHIAANFTLLEFLLLLPPESCRLSPLKSPRYPFLLKAAHLLVPHRKSQRQSNRAGTLGSDRYPSSSRHS